jgi:hypothetical protein
VPQASAAGCVQSGAYPLPPPNRPWQYVLEQVAPSQAGEAPPAVARGPKLTSTTPFECAGVDGTAWHSPQPTPAESAPGARCRWCAPTARSDGSVSPRVPTGGAAAASGSAAVGGRAGSP